MFDNRLETHALGQAVAEKIEKPLSEISTTSFDKVALIVIYDKLIALESTLDELAKSRRK